MLNTPLCIVNFKAYPSAVGKNAIGLAKMCEAAAKGSTIQVALAVQAADIAPVAQAVSLAVLAQHVDAVSLGARTGTMMPEAAAQAGAVGTLLNHSERRLEPAVIEVALKRAREAGLIVVLCAARPREAAHLARLNPDFLAIEPPELIGGSVSVATAKPEVVREVTAQVTKLPVLCGAGVKSADDVRKAVKLGVKGILLASGVTNAGDPCQALQDILAGF